jgi:hypothetical protein
MELVLDKTYLSIIINLASGAVSCPISLPAIYSSLTTVSNWTIEGPRSSTVSTVCVSFMTALFII